MSQRPASRLRAYAVAVAVAAAGLLASAVAAIPATANAADTAAAARTAPAHAAATAPHGAKLALLQARARAEAQATAASHSAAITGTVRGPSGRPLAGACVTAFGAGQSLTVPAKADGQFALDGLRPGRYTLEYRDCAAPATYLPRWSGNVAWRSAAAPVTVGTGQTRHVPGMTLLPARASDLLPSSATWQAMVARAQGRGLSAAAAASTGKISGVVTGKGKKLAGICVAAFSATNGKEYGTTTGKNGTYTLRSVAAGRYYVYFATDVCGSSSTNWLQQVYPGRNSPFATGRQVKVASGHTTSGINAKLTLGGQISGTVLSKSGRKLRGICIEAIGKVAGGEVGYGFEDKSNGSYVLHALFPGKYTVSATIGCGSTGNYAPVSHKAVKIGYGQVSRGVNLVMPAGGAISGTVTAATGGQPLADVCVFASNRTGSITGESTTGSAGTYKVIGLATGSYQLEFAPCDTTLNYVTAVGTASATEGKTTSGVNASLLTGATISGTVTDTLSNPVPGMCILLAGTGSGNIPESTDSSGSYAIDQLPAGTYQVGFVTGCDSSGTTAGNYAPYWYNNQTDEDLATPIVLTTAENAIANAVLQPGATISGTVTNSSGGTLRGACVAVGTTSLAEVGGFEAAAETAAGGTYSITGLAPGQYLVDFGCGAGVGKNAGQWFQGAADAGQAKLVSLTTGATTSVNAVLQTSGKISGVVTDTHGHKLAGVCVSAFSTADTTSVFQSFTGGASSALTNSSGQYTLTGLAPRRYHVVFEPCVGNLSYSKRWYPGKASAANATAVTVKAGATKSGVNVHLPVGGSISGRVVAASGKPLSNVCVEAYNLAQGLISASGTNSAGNYKITGLNSATYSVELAPCDQTVNRVSIIKTARVTAPKATKVNATLKPGGSLSGTLTATGSGTAVSFTCVEAVSANPANPGGVGYSDVDGKYSITGLAAGSYQVFFNDPGCLFGPLELAPQWYNNQPTQTGAQSVSVTVGATTPSIDAALQPDGEITGTVSGPSATALSGICVTAVPFAGDALANGGLPVVAVSNAGSYVLTDLLPGNYKVEFSSGCGTTGYQTQWWQDASSETAATALSVAANQVVTNINATMSS